LPVREDSMLAGARKQLSDVQWDGLLLDASNLARALKVAAEH